MNLVCSTYSHMAKNICIHTCIHTCSFVWWYVDRYECSSPSHCSYGHLCWLQSLSRQGGWHEFCVVVGRLLKGEFKVEVIMA